MRFEESRALILGRKWLNPGDKAQAGRGHGIYNCGALRFPAFRKVESVLPASCRHVITVASFAAVLVQPALAQVQSTGGIAVPMLFPSASDGQHSYFRFMNFTSARGTVDIALLNEQGATVAMLSQPVTGGTSQQVALPPA